MSNEQANMTDQNDHDLLIRIDTRLQDLIRDNSEYKRQLGKLEVEKCSKDEVNEKLSAHKKECEDKLSEHIKDNNTKLTDHESRMRKIERWMFLAAGALAILEIILSR